MLRNLCITAALCLATTAIAAPEGRVHVIDGDTMDIGGTRVRLHAIDAPELDQMCDDDTGATWACGDWVKRETRALFEGKSAICKSRDTDRYGRTVATCRIDGIDMGATLVTSGLAFAYRRYGMEYDLAEKGAAIAARGLHATNVMSPSAFRAARQVPGHSVQVRGETGAKTVRVPDKTASAKRGWLPNALNSACTIKGNISSKGVRIYHVPGQDYYDATRISATKGEKWFCSEAEARAAGWRKARK
ncbi:thermonuclease family protein [Marivita sp. S2033]|uniref:thermonuclease family protein n=1 Tax=Marivita sp. S2033 TaxID=3373187 RepID=UPI003981A59E